MQSLQLSNHGVKPARRKERSLSSLPGNRIDYYLITKQLAQEFGEYGGRKLPDAVMKHYRFVYLKVKVDEHHIRVYSDKKEYRVVKAPHPSSLRSEGLVSASRGAGIINAKYVNGISSGAWNKNSSGMA